MVKTVSKIRKRRLIHNFDQKSTNFASNNEKNLLQETKVFHVKIVITVIISKWYTKRDNYSNHKIPISSCQFPVLNLFEIFINLIP